MFDLAYSVQKGVEGGGVVQQIFFDDDEGLHNAGIEYVQGIKSMTRYIDQVLSTPILRAQ